MAQVGILTMQQIAMGRPPVSCSSTIGIRNQHVDTVVDFDFPKLGSAPHHSSFKYGMEAASSGPKRRKLNCQPMSPWDIHEHTDVYV